MLSKSGSTALLAVELTNDYIAYNHPEMCMFLTIFFGVLDPVTGVPTYINGEHETAFIAGAGGGIKARLGPTGPAVGLDAGAQFDFLQVTLEPGDLLLVCSDGVPGARNPHRERFTRQALMSLVQEPSPSAARLLERITAGVRDHMADAERYDDITMLAARRVSISGA